MNMRNRFLTHTIIFCTSLLLLTACHRHEDYNTPRTVDVTLSLNSVLSNFQAINSGDFTLSNDYRVRVQAFVYNLDGDFVCSDDAIVRQFTGGVRFQFSLPKGDYTLITTADVIKGVSTDNYSMAYWEYRRTEKLETFSVYGQDAVDYMGERTLALNSTYFTVNRADETIRVDATPVTAMISLYFYDIFYWDTTPFNGETQLFYYFDVSYQNDYNKVSYSNALSDRDNPWLISEVPTDAEYFILNSIRPDDFWSEDETQRYDNIYSFHAVLPGTYQFKGYGEYKIDGGNDEEWFSDETEASSTVRVKSGQQYNLDFDIKAWTTTFSPALTVKTRSAENALPSTALRNGETHNASRNAQLHRESKPSQIQRSH